MIKFVDFISIVALNSKIGIFSYLGTFIETKCV